MHKANSERFSRKLSTQFLESAMIMSTIYYVARIMHA